MKDEELQSVKNEKLMNMASLWATFAVKDNRNYTPEDARALVRDAYYRGFEQFYETIVLPMFESCKNDEHILFAAYATALADVINTSGFLKVKLPKMILEYGTNLGRD